MDDRRRRGVIPTGRGLRLLTVLLLLPLATTLALPATGAAKNARRNAAPAGVAVDSLWAGSLSGSGGVAACGDPSAPSSLASCFASPADDQGVAIRAVATDGTNVYFAGSGGGLSCPVADLGASCTRIMAGGWGSGGTMVNAIAAADGTIWVGQVNGEIYRCPGDLPYASGTTMPAACLKLDASGSRAVTALLLANGRLYAGLKYAGNGRQAQNTGILWSCPPDTANACITLDTYGQTQANALAAGGGSLWAGLDNGILWKCDPVAQNACTVRAQAPRYEIGSISHDGTSTIYGALADYGNIGGNDKGLVIACPTANDTDACTTLLSPSASNDFRAGTVAAGAGSVFSSIADINDPTTYSPLSFGTLPFTASASSLENARLLYLPAGGPVGVGGVRLSITGAEVRGRLRETCAGDRPVRPLVVRIVRIDEGERQGITTRRLRPCRLLATGTLRRTIDLLHAGDYAVVIRGAGIGARRAFTIEPEQTIGLRVVLR